MSKIIEYITVESKFRNRNKFMNPFNFDILVKNNNFFDKLNASDPVSSMSPLIHWSPSDLNVKGDVIYVINNTNIIVKINNTNPNPPFINKYNYYKYCYINYHLFLVIL